MSDHAQQSILQVLERLLPHIRRLEVENKATADEMAATTEAAIGEQLAKVIARDAALQRETEQQRAARERVAAVEAALIIEAIRAAPEAAKKPVAAEKTVVAEKAKASRPFGLPAKHEFLKLAPGDAKAFAENLGLDVGRPMTTEGAYRKVFEHLKTLGPSPSYESAKEQLVEEKVGSDPSAEEEEEFKTPTAQRTRVEGSGVKRGRRRALPLDPIDLLERIHGEILAGNHLIASETLRLGTNAVRTLVRRKELSADAGRTIVAELRAVV